MLAAEKIKTDHKDLIHDVAYNFHGQRMATSSCDQYIKIWDLVEGVWKCSANIKAHSGIVWKVVWAYPDFGQVIATCSNDKTVAVWEELANEDGQEGSHWIKRGNLVDSRSPIVDVKFAPRHHGLKLAMCSLDGNIRIYEAPDMMNLCQWNLQDEISCKVGCSCVAWGPSRLIPPIILVGLEDGSSLPCNVFMYEYDDTRVWNRVEVISTMPGGVRDISFSPNLGRSFDHVAIAGSQLTILRIRMATSTDDRKDEVSSKYDIQVLGKFQDHQSQVWKVSWNISGSILSSAGDDGCIRLWKGNSMDCWNCIAVLQSNSTGVSLVQPSNQNRPRPNEESQSAVSAATSSPQQTQHLAYIPTAKNSKAPAGAGAPVNK